MGKNNLIIDTQIAEFTKKYIPKVLGWEPVKADQDPFEGEYKLSPKDYSIHTSFFREAGIWLPLWPLLVDFVHTLP